MTARTSSFLTMTSSSVAANNNERPKPRRALTAYNLFTAFMRERILADTVEDPVTLEEVQAVALQQKVKKRRKHRKTHGLIGFQELSKRIAARWKEISPWERKLFEYQAMVEKHERDAELKRWKEEQSQQQPTLSVSPTTSSNVAGDDQNKTSSHPQPGDNSNFVGCTLVEATAHAFTATSVPQPVSPSSSSSNLQGSSATVVSRTPSPVSSLDVPFSASADQVASTVTPTSSCSVVNPLLDDVPLLEAKAASESGFLEETAVTCPPGPLPDPEPLVADQTEDLTDLWKDLDILLTSSVSPADDVDAAVPTVADDFPLMDYEMLESLVQ